MDHTTIRLETQRREQARRSEFPLLKKFLKLRVDRADIEIGLSVG
jgi:hypothetical protein